MNPWEQDWSGAAPQANDKAPWEQDWGKPSDVVNGRGTLDKVRDWTLTGLSGAGQGSMQAIAGIADTAAAPVAKTRSMLTGGAALVDRLYSGWTDQPTNAVLQGMAQDDAAAAEAKAQENASNSAISRGAMALRDAARERVGMLRDFDKEFNPELVRQQQAQGNAEGFVGNLKAIGENPMAFFGNLAQSAPAMAMGAGLGNITARGIGAAGRFAGMADDAILAAARGGAGAVGVASEAAFSGAGAREGIRSSILETPHAQLAAGSPRYQELMKQSGMTPALARDTLANEVSTSASLLTSGATALGSVLTNRIFGNLEAKMVAGHAVTAREAASIPIKESIEETFQGIGEDAVQHGAMLQADKNHQFDLGGSAAQNMAAGFAMSAPGSAGGYAHQRINVARGLNPDGTQPRVPNQPPATAPTGQPQATPPAPAQAPAPAPAPAAGQSAAAGNVPGARAAAPVAAAGVAPGQFDYAAYDKYRTILESGGSATAKNPESSATGLHQFTEGTWLATVAKAKPAWADGLSREQILAARTDPAKSTAMVKVLDNENAQRLTGAGQAVNAHTMYAAHHFGAGRAIDFAKASPDTPMNKILSPAQIRANSYLDGMTKAQAIANWDNRASKGGASVPAQSATNNVATGADSTDAFAQRSDISTEETDGAAEALKPREASAVDKVADLDKQAQAVERRWNDLNAPEYGQTFDAERADLQNQLAALRAERDQIARDWPKPEYGHQTSFATEAGVRLDGRYAIVDADSLVTSHNSLLSKNAAYPQELQPRERDRAASEAQISGIVNRLDPARLGLSADAATGAPIIGADGVVESGNARTIALMRAYEANGQKAADYRQFLTENAGQFGLSPEQVASVGRPVLVRVRDTPVDRAEFARQANASTVAAMSPSEQARSDAQRIDSMEDLTPNDDGDFATSRDFIRRFMARLPMTEQAGMVDSSGALSTQGYSRVRNAVLAKAYGDSPVLQRLTESMDDNLRNVSKALVMAAPEVAKMRSAIDAGARFDVDIAPDLLAAVTELSRLKDDGTSVADAVAQVGMFGEYSPEVRDLLLFLADNIRRPRRIADFVKAYYAALDGAGDPNQGSLLGDTEAPEKGDLMKAARQEAQGELKDGDTATKPRPAATAASDSSRAQAGNEGRVQRADEARRGQGDQVDGPARSEAAVDAQGAPTGEWRGFPADMGGMGIPRAEMPQIKAEHRGAFIQFLKGRGIEASEQHEVDAAKLKPTQAEFSMAKVEGFIKRGFGTGRSVLVSNDGYVLDGHHQWMAHAAANQDIPVIELGAPMRDLLAAAHEFPSVQRSEGATAAANDADGNDEIAGLARSIEQAYAELKRLQADRRKARGDSRQAITERIERLKQGIADYEALLLDMRRQAAVADFKGAMADLADIATKHQRAAIAPESAPDLMPTLVRLFDAAIRIVGTDVRAATRWVQAQLRANPDTKKLVNRIEPMTYRKAAEQAVAAAGEVQDGLFASTAEADAAMQDDLPVARPYSELSAAEKAAFDQRQGVRESQREGVKAPSEPTANAADLRNRASLEGSPVEDGRMAINFKSPESSNRNQRPSGKPTYASPPNDSSKTQPGGNLSGTFMGSPDASIVGGKGPGVDGAVSDKTASAADDALRQRFTLPIPMFGDVPYRASAPVDAGGAEVLSSRVMVASTKLTKRDVEVLGLSPGNTKVYAWRVSVVSGPYGVHSVIEAMDADHGRSSDGEVLARFKEVSNAEHVERVAPAVARAARADFAAAQAQELESYTSDDLRQRDNERQQADTAEQRQRQDDARRAQADAERGEFTLTGSDRAVDVAEAHGQQTMFSRARTPAQPRNLVTLHNLTVDNLLHADNTGGLPVPSLGITKVDSPFNGFGDITLIGPRGMIDPESGVPVFDRDAYTGRFPEMNYKRPKTKAADALYEKMKPARELGGDGQGFIGELWDALKNDRNPNPKKVAYLFERDRAPRMLYARDVLGRDIKVPMREQGRRYPFTADKQLLAFVRKNELAIWGRGDTTNEQNTQALADLTREVDAAISRWAESNPKANVGGLANQYRQHLFEDGGITARALGAVMQDAETVGVKVVDETKLEAAIRKVVPRGDAGYQAWVKALVDPLFDPPTITLRGREVEPTLDNLVAAMTIGRAQGAEKTMTSGTGKTAAMLGKQFKSIAEIQAARDQVVSEAAENEAKKSNEQVLSEYQNAVLPFFKYKNWKGEVDTWAGLDAAMEALADAGKRGSTDAAIRQALSKQGFTGVDQATVNLARQSIDALRNTPTNYFEAKPQRAVGLGEFRGAVVPRGTDPRALAVLAKHGIEVVEHGKGEGARDKAIATLSKRLDKAGGDVLFSRAAKGADPESQRQYREVERTYGGRAAYDTAKVNGRTNLTYPQWVQVRTPNFKAWFGDWENDPKNASKVVDPETGEPLVVYHGTDADFSRFNLNKLGANTIGYASSPELEQTARIGHWFNTSPTGRSPERYGAGYSVDMPVYLRLEAPLTVRSLDELEHMLRGKKGASLRRELESDGYDGVIVESDEEFGGTSYIAFRPNQIKSAIGNSGAFDPANPDIRMSRDGAAAQQRGTPAADLQAMTKRVAKALPNMPRVHVLQSTSQAPDALRAYLEKQGAMDDAEGAFHRGELYLFADNLASMERAEHVLATHESGHAGLAGMLGADKARVLQALLNRNDKLFRQAQAEAKRLKVPLITAVEEVLVDMKPADLVKLDGWRKVVFRVQRWLDKSGFKTLAKQMRQWMEGRLTDQQQADMLAADLMFAAHDYLAGREARVFTPGEELEAAFSRDTTAPMATKNVAGQDQGGAPAGDKTWPAFDVRGTAEELAARIRRMGTSAEVTHSGSAAGKSSYLRVGGVQIEVRVSDHSKGAFQSQFYIPVFDNESAQRAYERLSEHFGGEKTEEQLQTMRDRAAQRADAEERERWEAVKPTALREGLKRLEKGKRLSNSSVRALMEDGLLPSDHPQYEPTASDGSDAMFSRTAPATTVAQPQQTPAQRADALIQQSARTAQPLDAVARAITRATGIEWATRKAGSAIAGAINRYTPEVVKAGLVSDYGLDQRVRDERVLMQARQQVQLRKAGQMIDSLASLTREESAAAYRWMNETDPQAIIRGMSELPEGSVEKLQEVQRVIDKLSQEAVDLGQLDQRSYERNKFAYLHRSYAKHVLEPKGAKAARARTIAILGNQYKGRGTTENIPMAKVRQVAPDWWDVARKAGKADPDLVGKKLTRYDRLAPTGAGTQALPGMGGRGDGRVLDTVYLPADRPAPAKYAEWRKGETYDVRDAKGGDLVLWRDWSAAEREKMGEIDEARFAIAKTLHGMIRDVEVGRFLRWLARTQAKPTEAQLPAGATIVDASESLLRAFVPGEWVKVPESNIAGTGVKKYGELAGKYVEGPVWNEVRQALHTPQGFGKVYGAILNAWKLSKTALSPTVHMNNIMSNAVMADWHDVTAGHVAKALRIIMGAYDPSSVEGVIGAAGKVAKTVGMSDQDAAREVMKRYQDSGAELGSFVVNETMKSQVEPLLTAMEAELKADPSSTAAQVGVMSALQLLRQGEVGAAAKAAAGAQGARQVIRDGKNMIDLYQSEDAVFRLASWLKAKEEGKSDIEAGRVARRSFMDYNINAPWVQAARRTVLPFIAYTYRAAPMMADIAVNKPHKLMKLMAVAGAINALGSLLAGGADDDKIRKLLPKEKAGGVWGIVPKLIRMPWNDANGSPVFLDIRRWIPMGDVFDIGQGNSAVPIPPSLMPGGPLALAGELIANKSQFTGKPIVLETDTAGQKAGKVLDFVYKWAAPNVLGLPGSYATTGVMDAAKGRTDAFGRERSVSQAIASSVGLKLASYPRDILERNIILEAKGQQAELERGMRQLARQRATRAISPDEFDKAMAVEQGKLTKLRQETQDKLQAGRTAP